MFLSQCVYHPEFEDYTLGQFGFEGDETARVLSNITVNCFDNSGNKVRCQCHSKELSTIILETLLVQENLVHPSPRLLAHLVWYVLPTCLRFLALVRPRAYL